MSVPKGDNSAPRKGNNGTVDLKASGMTTEVTEGPHKGDAAAPDASKKHQLTSAG